MSAAAGRPARDTGETRAKAATDVESQLAELQRKFRILESNRKAYAEDAQTVIRRQRAAIEKLKADNQSLKNELEASASKEDSGPPNLSEQQEIVRLRETAMVFTRKIESEKKRVEELESQIKTYDARAMERRRTMGGVNAAREDTALAAKQTKLLENRLEMALVKLNEAVGKNKLIRDEIDNLRRERCVFDQVYKKLERELHEKKREIASVIDVSNIAYEARDQAQNEIAALRAQADKEQAAFEAEYRELGRLIEEDRRAREAKLKAEAEKIYEYGQQEDEKKKKVKGLWGVVREKKSKAVAIAADEPVAYDEVFAKIQAATGITHVEELVAAFVSAEDHNFSMFNYVNELNKEAEKLEEQATELQQEIQRHTGAGASENSFRKRIIQGLEEKVAAVEARSEALEIKYAAATRTIESIKASIQALFEEIGCSTAATRELLGGSGVTDSNVLQFLALIEQRACEIQQLYMQRRARSAAPASVQDEASEARVTSGHQPVAASASAMVLELPSAAEDFDASEDSSEEEDDDRPLTREELHARMQLKLQRAASRGDRQRHGRRK